LPICVDLPVARGGVIGGDREGELGLVVVVVGRAPGARDVQGAPAARRIEQGHLPVLLPRGPALRHLDREELLPRKAPPAVHASPGGRPSALAGGSSIPRVLPACQAVSWCAAENRNQRPRSAVVSASCAAAERSSSPPPGRPPSPRSPTSFGRPARAGRAATTRAPERRRAPRGSGRRGATAPPTGGRRPPAAG